MINLRQRSRVLRTPFTGIPGLVLAGIMLAGYLPAAYMELPDCAPGNGRPLCTQPNHLYL